MVKRARKCGAFVLTGKTFVKKTIFIHLVKLLKTKRFN